MGITRKTLTMFVIFLLLGIILVPIINSESVNVKNINISTDDKPETSLTNFEASSLYDYGLKTGKQFYVQYKLLNILAGLSKNNNIDEKDIEDQINIMEKNYPFFLEELKGLSAGCNIKLERLVSLQMFFSNVFGESFSNQCTVTLSTGNATKNNQTFLTQNIDTKKWDITRLTERILRPLITLRPRLSINTIRYRYVYFGLPILWEFPLMNEKGLGFGGLGLILTKNESRYIDEGPGISTYMLERLTMMTCKNVTEVSNLWKNMERASGTYRTFPHHWDNSISAWCDREGGILLIEQMHDQILTVYGNSTDITNAPEGILWHANHHQWLDPNMTGSALQDENLPSYLRAERAREILEEEYGNITIDVCKEIIRDYKGGWDKNKRDSADIGRIADEKYPSMTMFSWIIQPKNMKIYWTRGPPHIYRFVERDYSKIFQ